MEAYAILGGGGMKGIALAGCLSAAKANGIYFAGYGGTSAGALVALLGALRYEPDELRQVFVDDLDYRTFFHDQGAQLDRLRNMAGKCTSAPSTLWQVVKHWDLLSRLLHRFGVYGGEAIDQFVRQVIARKIPALKQEVDISFNQLEEFDCLPLKIVSTNIATRTPQVHSAAGQNELNGSVLRAIRASMCYPFAFEPVRVDSHLWLDGGLSSNLPVFLFRKDRERTGRRVMAFDLVSQPVPPSGTIGVKTFLGDMIDTALQAGDFLLRESSRDVFYVPVTMPVEASTLAIGMSRDDRERLFERGELAVHRYWRERVPQLRDAVTRVQHLQAAYEVPPAQIETVLAAIAGEFARSTRAVAVRANVMVPTGAGTRIVAYQFGMDDDSDIDLELAANAGCSGAAWAAREPKAADLGQAHGMLERWKMTPEQQNRVRRDRRAIVSVPLFRSGPATRHAKTVDDLSILGVLSVDSATPLEETGWLTDRRDVIDKLAKEWSGIVARLLS
jgi:NTE family protein